MSAATVDVVVWDEGRDDVYDFDHNDHVHSPSGECLKNRLGPRCSYLTEQQAIPEGLEPVAAWKARTVALLRVQERFSRDEAARIRSHYDEGGLGAPGASEVIRQEARAGAFASALDIVEGMAL